MTEAINWASSEPNLWRLTKETSRKNQKRPAEGDQSRDQPKPSPPGSRWQVSMPSSDHSATLSTRWLVSE